MKKALFAVAVAAALPSAAAAQDMQATPGVYFGVEGGLNWLFDTTILNQSVSSQMGWALGGKIGYDFVGPRIELEGLYRENNNGNFFGGRSITGQIGQVSAMANLLYDFNATGTFVPYVGVGAGVGFVDSDYNINSTVFAYQGILGIGYNVSPNFRVNIDGRYFGTTNPTVAGTTWNNNNISLIASVQLKFGAAAPPPPPPAAPAVTPPSFMVFFDWDRSTLSQQALATIRQAADAFKARGSARITATGHTDTSGPEAYNMALSLRRANAVKDALVRDGVPAQAISVVGRGEQGLLVQTADGVREPQNRRVEIVVQ